MAATDISTDPLLQLAVPQQLSQRIVSIESGARELENRIDLVGQVIPNEKGRIDNLIDQLENKVGPTTAKLELDFNQVAAKVEENKSRFQKYIRKRTFFERSKTFILRREVREHSRLGSFDGLPFYM